MHYGRGCPSFRSLRVRRKAENQEAEVKEMPKKRLAKKQEREISDQRPLDGVKVVGPEEQVC